MEVAKRAGAEETVIVAGHQAELISEAAKIKTPDAQIVIQDRQLGTGHAVKQAERLLVKSEKDILILYGDTPLGTPLNELKPVMEFRAPIALIKASFVGEYSTISAILNDIHSATSAVKYNIDCNTFLVAVFAASGIVTILRGLY